MYLNKEQIEHIIETVCPRCGRGEPVKFRPETGEYTHVTYAAAGFSSTICMATHLRSKYQDVLNG